MVAVKGKKKTDNKPATDLVEEAVHLLRTRPGELLAGYYAGTVPFALGILYFWSDMSRNPFAGVYCAPASLGLAMLFAWMKYRHAVFSAAVIAAVSRKKAVPRSFSAKCRLAVRQTFLHALGLVILPFAMLLSLPFGWAYAFFQNVSAMEYVNADDPRAGAGKLARMAWEQAKLWPGQNHILLSVLSVFGFFVFLNIVSAAFFLPQLLKMFLGVQSFFTMHPMGMLNTTFLAAVTCMTYICMDPLIKTVYALRCFYGLSLKTGEDIRAELKILSLSSKITVFLVLLILWGWTPACILSAGDDSPMEYETGRILPEKLDQSIEEVMKRREFAWRMPRDENVQKEKQEGLLADFAQWLNDVTKKCLKTAKEWIEWLRNQFSDTNPHVPFPDSGRDSQTLAKYWLYGLLTLLAILLPVLFWKQWRRPKNSAIIEAQGITALPDLNREEIQADMLPSDQWLELALELADQGEFRLAIRSLYLGTLARLAEFHMITIAGYKSNRDYVQEISRRGHDREPLPNLFSASVRMFESIWYGSRIVGRDDVHVFAGDQKKMLRLVQE